MKITKYHLTGSLYTLSIISWGVLLWQHFSDAFDWISIPALFCFVIATIIEIIIND